MIANIILFTILLYGANALLASKYYVSQKKDLLITYTKEINHLIADDTLPFSPRVIQEIRRLERNIGASISIGEVDGQLYYPAEAPLAGRHGDNGTIDNPFFELDTSSDTPKLTLSHNKLKEQMTITSWEQNDAHSFFVRVVDPDFQIDTLRFQTLLDNGQTLLIWVPMAEIAESISVSNRFTTIIALITLVITGIWSLLISKNFTRPITHMNKIAKKMLVLDFSETLPVNNEDEISQLAQTINELSLKLDQTISELHTKNQQLEADIDKERQLDNLRKDFISSVSHELKTPIFLIQGYAEGLKTNVANDTQKRQFYSDVIIEEADKMDFIVKDLLDLTQMESGSYSLSKCTFEIVGFTNDIIRKMTPLLHDKQVSLTLDAPTPFEISADPDRTEQVIMNYLTNALDHVDEAHQIHLQIEKTSSNKIRLSVYNSGSQIPDTSLDKIWNSFYKVDSARTRAYGGSGLGLSIVKNIQEAHHNAYGVHNVETGVVFWFEMDAE